MKQEEQLEKLNTLLKKAHDAVNSDSIVEKLGGVTIYAGVTDLFAIQAARLLEQILLKAQLTEGKEPTFRPHEDEYFYDNKISTRRIVVEVEKKLPFSVHPFSSPPVVDPEEINKAAKEYIEKTHVFLDGRNTIIHHIGNPKISYKDVEKEIETAVASYEDMRSAHEKFMNLANPFRFGEKEIEYFYGQAPKRP